MEDRLTSNKPRVHTDIKPKYGFVSFQNILPLFTDHLVDCVKLWLVQVEVISDMAFWYYQSVVLSDRKATLSSVHLLQTY